MASADTTGAQRAASTTIPIRVTAAIILHVLREPPRASCYGPLMLLRTFVAVGLLCACGSSRPPIENPRIEDLSWLEGDWVQCEGERQTWERWRLLHGELIGRGTLESAGQEMTAEDLHITRRGGVLIYEANPQRSPVEFTLVRLTSHDAVFENPDHDHPQRIAYRLNEDGTQLRATIEQLDQSRRRRWRFHKDACE